MIIKSISAIRDIDVIARVTGFRFDPTSMKAQVRVSLKKCIGQHVASPISEEMSVWTVPSSNWIILHVDFRTKHWPVSRANRLFVEEYIVGRGRRALVA